MVSAPKAKQSCYMIQVKLRVLEGQQCSRRRAARTGKGDTLNARATDPQGHVMQEDFRNTLSDIRDT
jgi:hypothetical protein